MRDAPTPPAPTVTMTDLKGVMSIYCLKSPSTVYDWIRADTMIEPFKLGARASRWLVSEAEAIAAARASGATDEDLRSLVADLRAARKQARKVAA